MRKLFSILSALLVLGMLFTSCSKSTDPNGDDPLDYSFKSATFKFMDPFSEDLANLLDITCTYTAMDGSTKTVKLDDNFEINFTDTSTKLPASFKVEVKVEKSANYETYKASKEEFNFITSTNPLCLVYCENQAGQKETLANITVTAAKTTIAAKNLDEYFDISLEYLNYTYSGTFEKDGNGVKFIEDK